MVSGLGLWFLSACGSNENQEERAKIADPKQLYCVASCEPDPGPEVVDCATAEAGLEFLKIWDFERRLDDQGMPMGDPVGEGMYLYDDYTAEFIFPGPYQPPSSPTVRCGAGDEHAMHVYGGPYLSWGGGIGRRVDGINAANCGSDPRPAYCPDAAADFPTMMLNLSEWEGVSFWARRGPEGQPGVRIAIGDKWNDDDISFKMCQRDPTEPRSCERTRECGCRSENQPCSFYDDPTGALTGYYCWNPAVDEVPRTIGDLCDPLLESCTARPTTLEPLPFGGGTQYITCGETKCAEDYAAFPMEEDTCFNRDTANGRVGKPCTYFAFRGGIAGDYCYEPGVDPPPAEGTELCGDNWLTGVPLSTEWQFYKIPFTELLQQGWAKEFPALDTSAITVVRFTWDKGWVDFWVDGVNFYRKARN